MRVIIAGGRDFNDYERLANKCIEIMVGCHIHGLTNGHKNDVEIICGKARGADTLGEQFGKRMGYKIKYFPADWNNLNIEPCKIKYNKFGKPYNALAGHNRNKLMAEYAKEDNGVLIAFHDGVSTGTKNMIDLANKYGLEVFVINY